MKEIENEIIIEASLEKVWDLLINPEKTPEYMYTCAVESDFKAGSSILWRGIHDQVLYVSGRVVEFRPMSGMVYTVIDPSADYEQIEENHLIVRYELEEKDGKTYFQVKQSGYETVAKGRERYEEAAAGGGWRDVLEKIKEMAER